MEAYFRPARVEVYVPGLGRSEDENNIYDLTLEIPPWDMTDQLTTRTKFNAYFDDVGAAVRKFLAAKSDAE